MRHAPLLAVSALLLLAALIAAGNVTLAQPQLEMRAAYVEAPVPLTDPESPLWEGAGPVEVPLSGQAVIQPMRLEPLAKAIKVRALHNGTYIAFLLEWPDPVKNDRTVKADEFRDAAAVQLAPAGETPFICMGSTTIPLNILHWKADWQADIEEGFRDVQAAYPNFWVDVYPGALGEPPYSLPEAFPEEARIYLPGWEVGNPLSQPLKVTAVEDNIAEGFGSIATQPHQDAVGRGVWENGGWKTVIARRLATGDPLDTQLRVGQTHPVAFAVWDGESGDVGARKSVTGWVALNIQPPAAPPPPAAPVTVTVTATPPPPPPPPTATVTVTAPAPPSPAAPSVLETALVGAVVAVVVLAAALLALLVRRRAS